MSEQFINLTIDNIEKEHLWNSIHEIPLGVLNGMNGASISDIPDMLSLVDSFEAISNKLKMDDDKTLIEDCRKFYNAYREYLKQQNQYNNFGYQKEKEVMKKNKKRRYGKKGKYSII